MAYIKQTFEDGGTLRASHLNHMEDGIADAHDIEGRLDEIDREFHATFGTSVESGGDA